MNVLLAMREARRLVARSPSASLIHCLFLGQGREGTTKAFQQMRLEVLKEFFWLLPPQLRVVVDLDQSDYSSVKKEHFSGRWCVTHTCSHTVGFYDHDYNF